MKHKIILASKSPRRHFLMREAGYDITIRTREIEETYPDDLPLKDVAAFLARKKALGCEDFLTEKEEVLVTSDTTVLLHDTIYGKPKDAQDAAHILRQLSGNVHLVITGVCLKSLDKEVVFSETAKVYFAELSDEEIEFYITKYKPFDKAGAYAIQEWIGLMKVTKFEGTYSNIMGLPMAKVYDELNKF